MLCSPFGAKAWSQQTQTSAMPLTRPRVSKIQHCVTYHPPRCQGMQANGSIEQRRFCRTRHEKPTRATGPIFRATHTRARLVLVLVLVQVPSPNRDISRHFAPRCFCPRQKSRRIAPSVTTTVAPRTPIKF